MPTETCPACGDDFRRPDREGARNAVIAHMTSKIDADHQGIGYEKANQLLNISDGVSETSNTDATEGAVETASTPVDSDTSGRAATDGGSRLSPPEPEAVQESTASRSDPTCPGCGATGEAVGTIDELIDKLPPSTPDPVIDALRQSDHACKECTTTENGELVAEVW